MKTLVFAIAIMTLLVSACSGTVSETAPDESEGSQEQELVAGVNCKSAAPGDYCGTNPFITGGAANAKYRCSGIGPATAVTTCASLCAIMPSGSNDVCAAPLVAKSGDLAILNGNPGGNVDSQSGLLWWPNSATGQKGGSALSASYKAQVTTGAYVTVNGVKQWRTVLGTRVDDPSGGYVGQCVSLVKSCGSSTAATSSWRPGRNAWSTKLPIGTAVATFNGVTYTGHVGFVCGYTPTGMLLCDENYIASGAVGRHEINASGNGGLGDAKRYSEVLVAQ